MSHTIIKEDVNIYVWPGNTKIVSHNNELTIGDLHGNAMKFMFMLVKQGIAKVNKKHYDQLVEIYVKPNDKLNEEDINTFNRILNKIKFKKAHLRLIGDELADRGSNDYFTLKILQKLHENHVPVEILISNHSIEFLQACEKYKDTHHFRPPMLQNGHADSLENLNTLVNKGLVSADEVLNITQMAYKKNLKILSYTLNDDNSEITIYSHAGIGLNTIQGLAKQCKVIYQNSTAAALAHTIDMINNKFQEHVQHNTITTLCPRDAMIAGYTSKANLTKTPLVCAMWNRLYDLIYRPASLNGYRLVYVHGHDSNDPKHDDPHVINLDRDNYLGKFPIFNKGPYVILSTKCTPKKLATQPIKQTDRQEAPTTTSHTSPEQESILPASEPLEQLKQSLTNQLQEIVKKEQILRTRGYTSAADAALKLHLTITSSYKQTTPQSITHFKKVCKAAIMQAQTELEHHRGWGLILSYLAATITGIGALVVIADIGFNLAKGKHFSFFKTDSAKKLSALEITLDEINELHFAQKTK